MTSKERVIETAIEIYQQNNDPKTIRIILESVFDAGSIHGKSEAFMEAAKIVKEVFDGK